MAIESPLGRKRAKASSLQPAQIAASQDDFASHLLNWFDQAGRHELPWLHPRTPYRVWLSEIMLQQTQVKTVIPYFQRFLQVFPTLRDLGVATSDQVMAQWAGLGYYARARNLHAAARICVEQHDGELPRDFEQLLALPGIGRSTAGAILAQAWGDRFPILDGNVKRLLARYHGIAGWPGLPVVEKQMWQLASQHLPATRLADYTQAQMDFGATLCTRHDPACLVCVLKKDCVALQQGQVQELPTSKPGKPLPERMAIMLLAENSDGAILLQRRPPVGIWAGLWSLPEAADHPQARLWFDCHLIGNYDQGVALDEILHVFSHYKLHIHPLRLSAVQSRAQVRENDDLRWVSRKDLASLGLPAPIRKLLES